jgi:predicted PurR-regulated permease PerM
VPWRTIAAVIGAVLATLIAITALRQVGRVISWLLVAAFFAVILTPAVDWMEQKAKIRRGLSAVIVFLLGVAAVAGMLYTFVRPIVDQVGQFVDDLPEFVDDAKAGEGTIGDLVVRFNVDTWIEDNQDDLQRYASDLAGSAPSILGRVFNTFFALATIVVLSILLLSQGPTVVEGLSRLVPPQHRQRARLIGDDIARAMSGYMLGNFLISLIAGVASYAFFRIAGVPYPEVLALWVAFTDLIPLIGATLGAVPTTVLAFLHSTPAGIAAIIFFVIYQQFENNVLQVTVMARTVDVNPLTVLISVLVGIDLFGYVGALLAIPAAGAIQAVLVDLFEWDGNRLTFRPSPDAVRRRQPPGADDQQVTTG